ncbi:MAG: Lrp/AsnC family transcriptional regulator [Hyphomicrobiales bacterium]|nr:Lrp/AsnC family transcriptional regulator [Hyphomicrobiales bacterium]
MKTTKKNNEGIDEIDRRIIFATQKGLPLVERPFDAIGKQIGISANEIKYRLEVMLENGIIRRIGAVPNHYHLGYVANGMSVWDIDDETVDEFGEIIGTLDYVSHCYKRPRHFPAWPYNLFAMIHAKTRAEVEEKASAIATILGDVCSTYEILYSTRILKKTGLRLCSPQKK